MKATKRSGTEIRLLQTGSPIARPGKQPRRQRQRRGWAWLVSIILLTAVGLTAGSPSLADLINIKLNGPLIPVGAYVFDFEVSPDGGRVVYKAYQDSESREDLYSVSVSGGIPVKLNGPPSSGGSVLDFKISPDSSRVVYHADQDTDQVYELYSVPIDGGTVIKLNDTLVSGGDVDWDDIQISADSSRVIYRADTGADEV